MMARRGAAAVIVVIAVTLLVQVCSSESHYKVLGVSKNATPKEIKKAYLKLARIWHPDKNKGSNDMMSKINRAYEILSDEDKRRHYDLLEYEGDDDYTYTTSDTTDDPHGSPTTDEMNTEQFMDNVLPASERTPYLIYFFHDFCDRCEDWSETLSEMKTDLTGMKMASVNVIISSKVATYCNVYVHEVPQLVLVLNRKPHPFQGSLSVETVKRFVYDHLPSNTTRNVNVDNVNDILSMESRIINNKPVVLLVSPRETPSLEYKIAAFNYQQYLISYYLSSLANGNSHILQKLNVKSKEHVLRVYTDVPEPVEILGGENGLEKYRFLMLPEVNSCVLLDELCSVGEDKNWCVLMITGDRTMKITNEFRNMATNWSNKRFKFGSLNVNQDSILRQSIPSLNITSQDHLCYNKTNSKSILILRRPSVHTLKYEWFDEYCGTQENNTKLSKLLQSDRVVLPHSAAVSESCWFLPVQTFDRSESTHINEAVKEALLVFTPMFIELFVIQLILIISSKWSINQMCSDKPSTKGSGHGVMDSSQNFIDRTRPNTMMVLSSDEEAVTSDEEEPHLYTSDDEGVWQQGEIGTRPTVKLKVRTMKDESTQTDNEFSSEDELEHNQQGKLKKRKPRQTRHHQEPGRSTVTEERVGQLQDITRIDSQWKDQMTSTDNPNISRYSSSYPFAHDSDSFMRYRSNKNE